jgi:hypothetical protein
MFCIDREAFMYQCAYSAGVPFLLGVALTVAVCLLAFSFPRGPRR